MNSSPTVKLVATIVARESFHCPACSKAFHPGSNAGSAEDFDAAVNHCLKDHGFVLLHVGGMTLGTADEPCESIAAVVGQP